MNALGFAWAFLVLVTSMLALIFGIVAFWKGNRQELSATEIRLARGGLFISCVWLLCFAIAVLLPHRHPSPVPILCTSELKMMRIALMLYHAEYDIFPAPSELEKFIEKENLYDESQKKDLERIEKECPGHHYVYWQPQVALSENASHIPLMADAEPYHKGKKNVLFLDGKVERLKPEELERLVPKNAKAISFATGIFVK